MYSEDPTEIIEDPRAGLQDALYELKRVIVGQDAMLERLLVGAARARPRAARRRPRRGEDHAGEVVRGDAALQLQARAVHARPAAGRHHRHLRAVARHRRVQSREGPIFANVVLGDEINRAPAKTQSALLEAMQEFQATIEGETRVLPRPFMVLATQNPVEQAGTYPLPEAQIDRFLFKLDRRLPERRRGGGGRRRARWASPPRCASACSPGALERYRDVGREVFVDRDVIAYAVALTDATRNPGSARAATSSTA